MFTVTDCPNHGSTSAPDLLSLAYSVECVNACITEPPHTHETGVSCWVCCPSMVVDPNGHMG